MTSSELLKALDDLKIRMGTWRAVAAELGTTTQTIQNWRALRYEPRAKQARRLMEVMNGK